MTTGIYGPHSKDVERFLMRIPLLSESEWGIVLDTVDETAASGDALLALEELIQQSPALEEPVYGAGDTAERIALEDGQQAGLRQEEEGIPEAFEVARSEARKIAERTMRGAADPDWDAAATMAEAAAGGLVVKPWLTSAQFGVLFEPFNSIIRVGQSRFGRLSSKQPHTGRGTLGSNSDEVQRFLEGVAKMTPVDWHQALARWVKVPNEVFGLALEAADRSAGDWAGLRGELARDAALALAAQDILEDAHFNALYGPFGHIFPRERTQPPGGRQG